MSHAQKYLTKCALAAGAFLLIVLGASGKEILGGTKEAMALLPGLFIYRFLWSDVLTLAANPPGPKIDKWLFPAALAILIVLAYAW